MLSFIDDYDMDALGDEFFVGYECTNCGERFIKRPQSRKCPECHEGNSYYEIVMNDQLRTPEEEYPDMDDYDDPRR